MIRLHVIAEGHTEQRFAHEVLRPHLARRDVYVDARCVLTSKDRRAGRVYRGGMTTYGKARQDILTWIKEDPAPECRFTTMFDLYALPDDFPGHSRASQAPDPYARVELLEDALAEDIQHHRFLPYIQLHEFESLLLAAPQQLDWEYLDHEQAIQRLVDMVGEQNPELINQGRHTAPSKRIIQEIPEYERDKTVGALIAGHIGLPTLRARCAHFGAWLTRLEGLAGAV